MYQFDEKWKEEVFTILLTPIYSKRESGIKLEDGKIYSGQCYYSEYLDPDMSDIAIEFYNIIYKNILKKPILDGKGKINDYNFAGDTMNSFNTIANMVEEAGKSRKERTPIENWPEYLVSYYDSYHCLANFWMVPLVVGRSYESLSKAKTSKDYMDRFLKVYFKNKKEYDETFTGYFDSFSDPEEFLKENFLKNIYVDDKGVIEFSNESSEKMISIIKEMLKKRAYEIANSKYAKELWNLFNELGFFK